MGGIGARIEAVHVESNMAGNTPVAIANLNSTGGGISTKYLNMNLNSNLNSYIHRNSMTLLFEFI